MLVHRTIKYRWHTIRERYSIRCQSCGSVYERSASSGYNEMATAEARHRYREELKAQAAEYAKATDFTCDSCRKEKLRSASPIQTQDLLGIDVQPAIRELLDKQAALNLEKRGIDALFCPLRNRIFLYDGEEYAQSSASFCPFDNRFRVDGYRINKRQPWLTTDIHMSAELDEVTYLDDTLEARKAAAEGKAA